MGFKKRRQLWLNTAVVFSMWLFVSAQDSCAGGPVRKSSIKDRGKKKNFYFKEQKDLARSGIRGCLNSLGNQEKGRTGVMLI